ncbi:MAG: glutaminase [Gammaproteobacteria bacterium]|jgi:glutaminase
MKQGVWLVMATILAVGGLISMTELDARDTVALQTKAADSMLVATDLDRLQRDARAVVDALAANGEGEVYSAAVEGTDPEHMALAVALVDGRIFSVGEANVRFPLMSISKPFTYALALEQHGVDFMIERIGVSATGFPYNAVAAGAVRRTSEQNPLVNAGAIATHSYIEGAKPADKISTVIALYSRMANRPLSIDETWRVAPRALTYTLAYQMKASGRLQGDVQDIAERYLESNIVAVTVEDLARMGATLATGGVQPQTGERILKPGTVRTVLSVMVIAGMYEGSGLWWTRVGLPAKSGVSGAILAVVPGWGAIAACSPRLDEAGNSVRAALAIRELADRWDLHSIDRLIKPEPTE